MSTGMGTISQEITSLITSYLPRWEHNDRANISERGRALLPAFATISRSWQHAIEYQTFREITIKSNELVELSYIVVNHHGKLLRLLEVNVILPTYTERACAKFEIYKDTQFNNLAFTKAIKDLLVLLRSWHDECRPTSNDNEASPQRSLRLCIGDCYSLMDCRYRGWEKYQEDRRESELGRRHDLFQHRYESSLLQLESIEGIPEIPQISSFHRSPGSRNIEPRSLAIIASRFPNLVSFRWRLQDNQKRDPRLSQLFRPPPNVRFSHNAGVSSLDATQQSIKIKRLHGWCCPVRLIFGMEELRRRTNMNVRHFISICLGCLFLFLHTAFCAPTQPTVIRSHNAAHGLNIIKPSSLFNDAVCGEAPSSSTSDAAKVGIERMTWEISATLSLALVICNWEPDPNTIQAVLTAAEAAIGKKSATELLNQKFTQKSNNRYNTLLFEISPEYTNERLTWGDVGEVLGENGLLKFYVTTQLWHTVYFGVVHTQRGELGRGAVRRWWQLEPPKVANGTM